jgi:phage tail sheath gpL-like
MGVTAELENLGDTRLSKEIAANIEHALSDRPGDWRVTIAGSRAAENWEMRVQGPNGFERTYTLTSAAGEHEPEAIRKLIAQMVPRRSS